MKTSVSLCIIAVALSLVNTKVHSKDTYTLNIPPTFELANVPKSDDPWIKSLISNLARRAGVDQLTFSVWRRTNIVGTYHGESSSVSVYARDGEDNRFLVWSPECISNHGGRPWLVSWDHGSVYETNSYATTFYRSPSGRYFVVIASSSYGPTYARGRLSPRSFMMEKGSERLGTLTIGEAKWDYTLKIDQEGIRSATWGSIGSAAEN
jgi:hypothetical protein